MNRFTSILLAGLIASASALGISPKADANTRVDYLAGLDSYGYQHNDDGYYERQSRHHRNDDYERENYLLNIRDNNYRYERENYRRHDRDYNRRYERENNYRYERENNRRYERYNNIRNNRDNNNRYEHERDWGRG
ncbi:hypothetical protein [Nostoc sp.]|uniref:hypothetical protein n=1 Tax=Nostoc sp. TaxID=1180 RepID=UPI002FF35E65